MPGERKKFWLFFAAFLLLSLIPMFVFAGITGKISGRIVDDKTGEPLPGANVLVLGTTMGAASDIDGVYTILSVPPGNYTLRITMMGYSTTDVKNVQVFAQIKPLRLM